MRLGVNIDHVATLRNARGGTHPCPIRAAELAAYAGADGITAHLREDRRHIRDEDMRRLKAEVNLPLNFEMAATDEMQTLALEVKPNAVCLVPEKREELTTEGGLDVAGQQARLTEYCKPFIDTGIRVSLFIDANAKQLEASKACGADIVELHTGHHCDAPTDESYQALVSAAEYTSELGLECHAGHGISFQTVKEIAAIPQIMELNIGHFLVGEAVFCGFETAIQRMRKLMDEARI
ncbi:MAG: pyridoxine 5'-phosphate synthase [Rickettsiales bacterium]|nr:pyridoxine 5'-phosphate synthase [Rickettsiales bacterium]